METREFFIGVYKIQELVLRVSDEEVVFSPKGTNIVGAQGRIERRRNSRGSRDRLGRWEPLEHRRFAVPDTPACGIDG